MKDATGCDMERVRERRRGRRSRWTTLRAAEIWGVAKAIWFVPDPKGLTKLQRRALNAYCLAMPIAVSLFGYYAFGIEQSLSGAALLLLFVVLLIVVPLIVIHVANVVYRDGGSALFRRSSHVNGLATLWHATVTIYGATTPSLVIPILFPEFGIGLGFVYCMLLILGPIAAVNVARFVLAVLARGLPALYRRLIDNSGSSGLRAAAQQ